MSQTDLLRKFRANLTKPPKPEPSTIVTEPGQQPRRRRGTAGDSVSHAYIELHRNLPPQLLVAPTPRGLRRAQQRINRWIHLDGFPTRLSQDPKYDRWIMRRYIRMMKARREWRKFPRIFKGYSHINDQAVFLPGNDRFGFGLMVPRFLRRSDDRTVMDDGQPWALTRFRCQPCRTEDEPPMHIGDMAIIGPFSFAKVGTSIFRYFEQQAQRYMTRHHANIEIFATLCPVNINEPKGPKRPMTFEEAQDAAVNQTRNIIAEFKYIPHPPSLVDEKAFFERPEIKRRMRGIKNRIEAEQLFGGHSPTKYAEAMAPYYEDKVELLEEQFDGDKYFIMYRKVTDLRYDPYTGELLDAEQLREAREDLARTIG